MQPTKIDEMFDFLQRLRSPKKRPVVLSPTGCAYAGFQRRMFASVIDSVMITIILMPFNDMILTYAYANVQPELMQMGTRAAFYDSGILEGIGKLLLVQCLALGLYSLSFWHFLAATPGKLALRMIIVDAKTDAKPNLLQYIARLFGYAIATLPLMLGFFAIDWNERRRGWHDRIARTAVIIRPRAATPAPAAADPSDSPAPAATE